MKATDTMYEGDLRVFALLGQWDHSVDFDMPRCAVRLESSTFAGVFCLSANNKDMLLLINFKSITRGTAWYAYNILDLQYYTSTYAFTHIPHTRNFKNWLTFNGCVGLWI